MEEHKWRDHEGEEWVTGRFQALVRQDDFLSQDQKVKGIDFVCLAANGKNSFGIYESINPDPHFITGLCVRIAFLCVSLHLQSLVLSKIHTSDNGIRKLGEVELQAIKNDTISMDICFGNSFC